MIAAHVLIPILLVAADTGVTHMRPAPTPAVEFPEPDLWFAEDKVRHFVYSYAITTGSAAAARTVTGHQESILIGAALGLMAGVAKELYDKKGHGSASWRDLLWDAAGVTIGVLVAQQAR